MFLEKIGEKVNKTREPVLVTIAILDNLVVFNILAFLNLTYNPINLSRNFCNVNLLKVGFV